MKLFSRKYGHGKPLLILHGLFGQSDNWNTLGKKFAENFEVHLIDLRNHGLSPRTEVWNYDVMSEDIFEYVIDHQLKELYLIGHSMGGKVAMAFSEKYPELIDKMVICDIAPKYYPVHHHQVLNALNAVDLSTIQSRKEAEEVLIKNSLETDTRQFLLKNLYWTASGVLDWRFNLKVITANITEVGKENLINNISNIKTLFIRGDRSDYITDEDLIEIVKKFPFATSTSFANAGHWIHAEQPKQFYDTVMTFLGS